MNSLLTSARLMAATAIFVGVSTAPVRAAGADGPWTGLFVGGTVGESPLRFEGSASLPPFSAGGQLFGSVAAPIDSGVHASSGAGVHVGYERSAGQFVVGAEVAVERGRPLASTTLGGGAAPPFSAGDQFQAHSDRWVTLRGRVGIGRSRWLVYGAAGPSTTTVTMSASFPASGVLFPAAQGSSTRTVVGIEAAGGAEFAVNRVLTVGGEFRYRTVPRQTFGLGNLTAYAPPAVLQPVTADIRLTSPDVTLRVTWRPFRRP